MLVRAYGLHVLLLGGEYGAYDFAVKQCVADCLHESAFDDDFWRAYLQERTPWQAADSRVRDYVYRHGACGAEWKVYSEAFAGWRFARVQFGMHVDYLFLDCPAPQRKIFYVVYHAKDVFLWSALVNNHYAWRNGFCSKCSGCWAFSWSSMAELCRTGGVSQLPLPYGLLVAVWLLDLE